MKHARRNVFLLASCQALLLTNAITLMAISALAGYSLVETKAFATLPVTSFVLGGWVSAFPASLWMRRAGRRGGFLTGGLFGLAGSTLAAFAMFSSSFVLLCAGSFLLGVYNAFGQYYRFAAADVAPPDFKARAISLVLAGGVVGGILGPELSRHTIDLADTRFLASYASLFFCCLLAMGIVGLLRIPLSGDEHHDEPARPLAEIARQPVFIVAASCAALGFGVMTLLMTATPLAMGFCGFTYSASAGVIAAHAVAMFAPSFFTGSLIQRFGALSVILAGLLIQLACVTVAVSGEALPNFWWALVLLGVGWNFTYLGGTALLTEAYRPAEKAKVQGLNESIIFGAQALASLSSGVVVSAAGWNALNHLAVPLLAVAGFAALWLMLRGRTAPSALSGS